MNDKPITADLSIWTGAVTTVSCAVVLLGWVFDVGVLKSIVPGFATMKINTALGLIAIGMALIFQQSHKQQDLTWVTRLFAMLAVILGAVILVEYAFHWNAGIDEFFIKDKVTSLDMYPGRPSQMTAFDFFILGGALFTSTIKPTYRFSESLSMLALLVAFVAVVGYVLDVNALYGADFYSSMALHTCIFFFLCSIAVWWGTPGSQLQRLWRAPDSVGIMARRMIPIAVIVPVLLSILWLHGARSGLYSIVFGWALLVVTNIVCLVAFVFVVARPMVRIERDRRRITQELEKSNHELEDRAAKLAHANELLHAISNTDPLTEVGNRRAFNARLLQEFEMIQRYPMPLTLLLLDLDQYKTYNDEYGHQAGDEVLLTVAGLLKEHARKTDFVARIGGDEFAIILTETDMEGAMNQAERFRSEIETFEWRLRPITVSIGIAEVSDRVANDIELFQAADEALYVAKNSGRNQVFPAMKKFN